MHRDRRIDLYVTVEQLLCGFSVEQDCLDVWLAREQIVDRIRDLGLPDDLAVKTTLAITLGQHIPECDVAVCQ